MNSLKRKASSIGDATDAKKPKSNGNIASFFGSAPKPTESRLNGTSPSMAVSKFDKAKWVATLNEEQKKLLALEIDTLDESWLAHLKDDITSKDFLELKKFLDRETAAGKKWFPPKEDIYSWYVYTRSLFFLLVANKSQVTTYKVWERQSSHPGPRPLSQCQPGARHGVLRTPSYTDAAITAKHVHMFAERLP